MMLDVTEMSQENGKVFLRYVRCPRCGGPMVLNVDFEEVYCGSWEYMEGGCPPAPIRKPNADGS